MTRRPTRSSNAHTVSARHRFKINYFPGARQFLFGGNGFSTSSLPPFPPPPPTIMPSLKNKKERYQITDIVASKICDHRFSKLLLSSHYKFVSTNTIISVRLLLKHVCEFFDFIPISMIPYRFITQCLIHIFQFCNFTFLMFSVFCKNGKHK